MDGLDGMGYLQTGPFLDHLAVIIKTPIGRTTTKEIHVVGVFRSYQCMYGMSIRVFLSRTLFKTTLAILSKPCC